MDNLAEEAGEETAEMAAEEAAKIAVKRQADKAAIQTFQDIGANVVRAHEGGRSGH